MMGVLLSGAVWWAGPGDNWCIILSQLFATLDVCISVNLSVTHSFIFFVHQWAPSLSEAHQIMGLKDASAEPAHIGLAV